MCLCITLLFLYIFFIIMTVLDRYAGEPEVGPGLCGVIAAGLHFTTLSSMSWMGVEGINMFLMVVRAMDSSIPLFMMKASIIAWGIPAAIVFLTGAISRQNYSYSDYCFLQKWPLVGGLLIPMAFTLALNLIIFALVMRRLMRINSSGGKTSELKSETRLEIMRRLTNGIGILLLLGLTWLVGYFTVIEQINLAVHVIFILLNSLQGFFIFVFYVLRQPKSHACLREHLGCCFHDSPLTTDAGPMSMKQTTMTITENPISESVLSKSDIDEHISEI
ncbi:adhesion G-protein coupled receptor G6-like [Strongylocentrotus purpuratus]|uniref:G-protein coupled receptors family 2 profile 2 domain-containing protein n=1 Tax=Strongylocentrotus purpuratus TaxID=7668 RepID=A0A7M7G4B5_STRPU|nr:adhesion G-protein coupled receptor G6-like [Strongylocentrotus purpuratus]|eukprot:XP_001199941.1 PREDICTED: G-protein coupled receptor 126-like [Strongylocentrotus purpuratus]